MNVPKLFRYLILVGVVFRGGSAQAAPIFPSRGFSQQQSDGQAEAQQEQGASQAPPGEAVEPPPGEPSAAPAPSSSPSSSPSGAESSAEAAPSFETEERLGPYLIGGRPYAVVLRQNVLRQSPDPAFAATLAELEVRDADNDVLYQETFSSDVTADGRFAESLSASMSLLAGSGGSALVVTFVQRPATAPGGESWQVLGIVGGQLALFGPPLPLGQGEGIAVGGVLAGVMVKGGIGVVPLASTADELEFRVWQGRFYVLVPVRVDWPQGKWSEGEACYELTDGNLRPKGCNLRVEALPLLHGADPTFVTLFGTTDGNTYNAQQVQVRGDSRIAFIETRAVANWMVTGDRFACSFDDVWLHVQIDGKDGWVHGDEDFVALGLPAGPPR